MKNNYTKEQKTILTISLIASFITTFMGSALNLSIPQIEKTFNSGASQVGWIVTIYILTCGALAVPMGKAADLYSRNIVMKGGLLLFSLGSAFGICAGKMLFLLASRFVQAIGASMIFSTNNAILSSVFQEEKRRKVLGLSTGATYMGMAAGPVLGGIFDYYIGWKSIFGFAAIVGMTGLLISLRVLSGIRKSGEIKSRWDWLGTALYVGGITGLMYGLSALGKGTQGLVCIIIGAGLLVLFVMRERLTETPLLDVSIIAGNKTFLLSNIAAMINFGAIFAMNYLLSIYLQVAKGFSSGKAGLILIILPLILAAVSVFISKKNGKIKQSNITALGMMLCTFSLGLLAFLKNDSSIVVIIISLVIAGAGQALFAVFNVNTVMNSVSKEHYGMASSIYSGVRSIGHTISMALVTVIIQNKLGNVSLLETVPETMTKTANICFFALSIWCIVGIFMARRKKV